jgi:sulfur-carrier protein
VVACNSASAAAFDELRAAYPLPVVEVIEPAVRAAVRLTRNRTVGLIGTEGTIGSGRYREAVEETHENVTLVAQACPRFVEYVERGETTGQGILDVAAEGDTVRDLLGDLDRRYPGIAGQLLNADGSLHRFVNVYVNDEDVRFLGALDAKLDDGDVVAILPAVAGGG